MLCCGLKEHFVSYNKSKHKIKPHWLKQQCLACFYKSSFIRWATKQIYYIRKVIHMKLVMWFKCQNVLVYKSWTMVKVRVVMQPLRIGRLFVVLEHKETQTSDHILHNADRYLHLIQYVNTCVTKATTNKLCYQPHGGKWNHTGWAAWAQNTMVKQWE